VQFESLLHRVGSAGKKRKKTSNRILKKKNIIIVLFKNRRLLAITQVTCYSIVHNQLFGTSFLL